MTPALTKLLALVATSVTLFFASIFISDLIKRRLRSRRDRETKAQYDRLVEQDFYGTLVVFREHFKGAIETNGKRIEFEFKKNRRRIDLTCSGATLSWPTCSIRISFFETTFALESNDECASVKTFFQPGNKLEIMDVK